MKYYVVFIFLTLFCSVLGEDDDDDTTECDDNEFSCISGECIGRNEWCDASEDCDDGSDEKYCKKNSYFNSDPNSCKNKPNLFLCKDGPCYPISVRCDGYPDCQDGSDEGGCTTTTSIPTSTPAIDRTLVTTGMVDKDESEDKDITDDIDINLIDIDGDSYPEQVKAGLKWLFSVRKSNYGWGHNTPRALVALGLAKPDMFSKPLEDASLMKKQLQIKVAIDFVRNYTEPVSLSRLALYINAMLATCQDPRNFHGLNLVKDLRHRTISAYRLKTAFVNPIALLTLCIVGESTESDIHKLMETVRVRAEEQRWIDMQYISVMALACIVKNYQFGRHHAERLQNAVTQVVARKSDSDGSFGNIYSTALAVQAMLAAQGKKGWRAEQSLKFLADQQLDSGSFGDLLSTYYILPALAGRSLASLKDAPCLRPNTTLVKGAKLVSLDSLLDYQGPRHYIRYSLYYGNPIEVSYSVLLHVPLNTTFFDVMRLAAHIDPKFKFQYESEPNKAVSVYSIGSVPNDAEKGNYWQLFANLNQRRHHHQIERLNGNANLQRYMHGVTYLIPKSGDHIAFWYRPIGE